MSDETRGRTWSAPGGTGGGGKKPFRLSKGSEGKVVGAIGFGVKTVSYRGVSKDKLREVTAAVEKGLAKFGCAKEKRQQLQQFLAKEIKPILGGSHWRVTVHAKEVEDPKTHFAKMKTADGIVILIKMDQ